MSLSRAQNIFMPANINSIVILNCHTDRIEFVNIMYNLSSLLKDTINPDSMRMNKQRIVQSLVVQKAVNGFKQKNVCILLL